MNDTDLIRRLMMGAAAGLAGTMALQGVRGASQKYLPDTMEPTWVEPSEFMVDKVESALPENAQEKIPGGVETAAGASLGMGYGATAGALYAAFRDPGANPLIDGTVLGLATWAAGYLGWMPALGLMPPVTEQGTAEAVGPAVRHALYGVAVVGAYNLLAELVD